MSPVELRKLAARLEQRGEYELAIAARTRASEREVGETIYDAVKARLLSFMSSPPPGRPEAA